MSNAGVSLMTGKVNNLPTVQETWVQYLSVEDPLEKSGYHSSTLSILAARIPWTEEPGGLYGAWGHKESERTERVTLPHFSLSWVMKICLLVFPAHVIWFYFPHPLDQLSSVQSLSLVRHFVTPWASQASLFITNSWNSPKPLSIESVMPSNHLILCCPILLLPSIFPVSGSFPMNQLFVSGGQRIGVSASTSVLPMNTQNWFPVGWTGWISLQSKGFSRVFFNTTVQKCQFFGTQFSL